MSSYSDLVLAHGSLRVYYRMGEPSGTTLDDSGSSNIDGAYGTGVTLAQAGAIANDADTAVEFDAAGTTLTQALDPGSGSAFDVADGPFSIEFWLKRTSTQGTLQTVVNKGTNAYEVRFHTDNKIHVFKSGTAGNAAASSVALTDTGSFHHIVVTKVAGATPLVYIDAVDVTTAGSNHTLADSAISFRLGALNAASQRLDATLDEVALYGAVLTPAEVLQHYDTGRGQHNESDSVSATDARTAEVGQAQTDTATASDSLSVSAAVALPDSVTASDGLSGETGPGLSDTATASDALTVAVEQALSDTATIADALASEGVLTLGDSVTVTDQDTEDLGVDLAQGLSDTATVSDDVLTQLTQPSTDQPGGWYRTRRRELPHAYRLALEDFVLVRDDFDLDLEEDPLIQIEDDELLLLV